MEQVEINRRNHSHLVEVDEAKKRLTIFRIMENGEKVLFTYTDLPTKTFGQDPVAFREFAQNFGENILVDSPAARKILGL